MPDMSMRAAGLPPGGYIEWAAEATYNRRIIVVTSVGVTAALARAAGFLQGSAFSCCVVNYVVAVLVMRLWEGVAFTAKAPAGGTADSEADHVTRASYGFSHGGGMVDSASFCDDNGRFTRRLPDLVLMVVLFGVFSLVSGIGRSAKASYVMAVNVDVQKEMENTAKWDLDLQHLAQPLASLAIVRQTAATPVGAGAARPARAARACSARSAS